MWVGKKGAALILWIILSNFQYMELSSHPRIWQLSNGHRPQHLDQLGKCRINYGILQDKKMIFHYLQVFLVTL